MDALVDFLNWAWARHHNPLSWYIRPLFILPFWYFAYKRNMRGMVLTLLAVTSSMFWFPAPSTVDPAAATFLAAERRWITGPPTLSRLVLPVLIPIWFIALAAALRRRLWAAAVLVIAVGTVLKVAWSFYVAGASAWVIVPPVALGNAVCAGILAYAYRRCRTASASAAKA